MRVAWISASPIAQTGYGKITNEIVSRLIARHKVFCIGGIGGQTVWGGKMNIPVPEEKWKPFGDSNDSNGIVEVLPTVGDPCGGSVAGEYVRRHKLDLVIALWDVFSLGYLNDLPCPTIPHIPIDAPFTKAMYNYIWRTFKVVAYSKYGYSELLKWFDPARVDYVPHGIDCQVFQPYGEDLRREVRRQYNIPEDAFVVFDLFANVGERKQAIFLLHAFKEFNRKHKDTYLYLFTNKAARWPMGYNLQEFIDMMELNGKVGMPDFDPILEPLEDKDLARLYSAMDVMLHPSIGEGFGVPFLESQACGLPVIALNSSTMKELIQNGWLIKTIDDYPFYPVWIPTGQKYFMPSLSSTLECLEEAYNSPSKLEHYGKEARQFTLQYDWNKFIMPQWFRVLEEVEADLKIFDSMKFESSRTQ